MQRDFGTETVFSENRISSTIMTKSLSNRKAVNGRGCTISPGGEGGVYVSWHTRGLHNILQERQGSRFSRSSVSVSLESCSRSAKAAAGSRSTRPRGGGDRFQCTGFPSTIAGRRSCIRCDGCFSFCQGVTA